MYVITADQVNSRSTVDIVTEMIGKLTRRYRDELTLTPERTAGDELQLLVRDADTTLNIVLELTRTGRWSAGLGIGDIIEPIPDSIREASGPAFIAARTAVERAKKRPTRFAIEHASRTADAEEAEAFIDLLLVLRSRRTPEGWELYDIVDTGVTQAKAAHQLGISPQAVSKRALAADLRAERAAITPLTKLVERLGTLAEPANSESANSVPANTVRAKGEPT